jgi:hypothetical protein
MVGGQDPSARAEQPHALIVGHRLFKLMVQAEVEKAVRIRYPVSLVTVLVEPPASEAVQLTREAISLLIRRSDVISLVPGLSALHLLLPDALLPETERVIERIRARALSSSLTLKFGAACFPTTAQTARELLEQADQRAVEPKPDS